MLSLALFNVFLILALAILLHICKKFRLTTVCSSGIINSIILSMNGNDDKRSCFYKKRGAVGFVLICNKFIGGKYEQKI